MSHASAAVTPELAAALDELARDLARIFGARLQSLVAYGEPGEDGAHTLALAAQLTVADLDHCARQAPRWHRLGLATPLLMTGEEFRRTVDVFPLEYGAIIARHVVVSGADPFEGVAVREADLRRGCEQQAKSHLIHLREGFIESGGAPEAVSRLIASSAPALRALLVNLERLEPGASREAGVSDELVSEVARAADTTIADPKALFSRYVAAVERLWQYVDRWR